MSSCSFFWRKKPAGIGSQKERHLYNNTAVIDVSQETPISTKKYVILPSYTNRDPGDVGTKVMICVRIYPSMTVIMSTEAPIPEKIA